MGKAYRFKARILQGIGGGAYVEFPHDAREAFGTGGRVPVKVTFDGEPYRGSLAAMGGPCRVVGVLKSIRERLGKTVGDTVAVVLERDTEERVAEVPPELKAALEKDRGAAARFETMAYSHRREWARFVGEAKNPETRVRRAAKAVLQIREAPAAASKKAKQ